MKFNLNLNLNQPIYLTYHVRYIFFKDKYLAKPKYEFNLNLNLNQPIYLSNGLLTSDSGHPNIDESTWLIDEFGSAILCQVKVNTTQK